MAEFLAHLTYDKVKNKLLKTLPRKLQNKFKF